MLKKGLLIGLFALITLGFSPVSSSDQTKPAGVEPIWLPCITCPCYCVYYCGNQYDNDYEIGVCMDGCLFGCSHG